MNEHERWVNEWIRKAENDIETALVVLDSGKSLFDSICFHCQQCAEKYLKSFLIHSGRPVSKTHDLETLLQFCTELDSSFSELERYCLILNDYAVGIRYPDDALETTRPEAEEALRFTKAIRSFVRNKFPFIGSFPQG